MRETGDRGGFVLAVFSSPSHSFTKPQQPDITLLEGLGVEGDAHCGVTVKHRHDAKKDPMRPNYRQVHLLQAELLDEVKRKGFDVGLGELGENIATRGIDLLALPTGAILHIGGEAVVRVTGLRNPCIQIERFRAGLLEQVLERRAGAEPIRKMGVMGVIVKGGRVRAGDDIQIAIPAGARTALQVV